MRYTRLLRSACLPMAALLTLALAACDDEPTPDAGRAADAAPESDRGAMPDAGPTDAARPADAAPRDAAPRDAAPPDASPPDTLPAERYCEEAVDVFCPYYVRCGRMAVADETECRSVFIESCNAKYEPIYAAHAARGELALSRAGLGACRAHLAAVDCGAHDFDLDGPCAAVWRGLVPAGGTCGPGIGTFICAEGTACRLSVETLCGTCDPVVPVGAPCGEGARCAPSAACRGDTCVARPTAGQPCAADGPPCAVGSSCRDGVCAIRPWAAPGAACGQGARCQYKSECVDGTCVEGALLGAPCGPAQPCATGWCDGGTCAPPEVGGSACAGGAECVSGACAAGLCLEPRGVCFGG